ncbi:MAG: phosphoribosyltransferase [Spirochaetales bacterium]
MEKLLVTYEDVHRGCAKLAGLIQADGWEPDVLVAIASGGFIPARILKTYLKKPIYVVGLQRYDEDHALHPVPIKIQWLDEVEKKLRGKKILIVDEVDDTRVTLSYCLAELSFHGPAEMRVAVLHQKNKPKEGSFPSGTVVYQAIEIPDLWIQYPWDALDIDAHNQAQG